MTLQIVITRAVTGDIRVLEMGLGANGMGETLREHDLQVSDPMCAKYIVDLIGNLHCANPEPSK